MSAIALRETGSFVIREAVPSDNEGLLALAESCVMAGDVELRIDRRPDFFALNRLEGNWRLAVAERDGEIAGCICFSERESYVSGFPRATGYVGDLKVHPGHRDGTIADALSLYGRDRIMENLSEDTPVLITVLAGNSAMERRLSGPRGLPEFGRVATIRVHSLSVLWKRKQPANAVLIKAATWADVDEMADLWSAVAPLRQLAPVFDAERLATWIREAPGLDISCYRLARDINGRLLGFFGLWDQRQFKQMNVVGYSSRMAAVRRVFNFLAPIVDAEPLPDAGSPLALVTAVNVCVPSDRADVLRTLIIEAHNELRHTGCSLLNIGLDVKDPLTSALNGLFAQPTDVHAYLTDGRAKLWTRPLDGPFHYEIALV